MAALPYAERYGLSPAEEAWREKAERFARDEVAPLSRDADRERRFPTRLIPRMAELGILSAPIPKAHGGQGASALSNALVHEEVGRVDGSVRGFLAVHVGLVSWTIADHGTAEQRRRWLPGLLSGRTIGCFAMTEPDAGSDAGAIATTIREDGDSVVIDGQKHWITNGLSAGLALVFGTVDPALGKKGIECYVVEPKGKGWRAEPMEGRELGHRASEHARVTLEGLRVPRANRLGPPREGFRIAMSGLDHGRLSVAAGAVGIHAACLDEAVRFARTRRQFGSRIGDFQQVGARLADLSVSLECSRLLVHHAARTMDRGAPASALASAAKLQATEGALVAAMQGLKVLGARGYSDESAVERHYRDAIGLTIYEGTSEIQRLILARDLLGKDEGPGRPGGKEPR